MTLRRILSALMIGLLLPDGRPASAIEASGFAGWNAPFFGPQDPSITAARGGVGYGFSLQKDLGPGALDAGLWFLPASLNFTVGTSEVQASGSYWVLPLLYRIPLLPPFLSFAVGPDFALRGGTTWTLPGTSLASAPSSGFRSHFGAQASLQALQDLGENLSLVLDLRYRYGIGPAISVQSTTSTWNSLIASLGIQKRLE